MNELVSVVIPVYNVEKYLEHCVFSVMVQTYQNIEIILVDDGSTDSSGVICDELSMKDDRIRVLHKGNGGVSSARNAGAQIANGDYIGFVDADDYISEHYVDYLLSLCRNNNADISICNFVKAASTDIEFHFQVPDQILVLEHKEIASNRDFDICKYAVSYASLMRIELVLDNPFPVNIRYGEDTVTMAKWLFNAKTIAIGKKALYCYYQNQNSATGRPTLEMLKGTAYANSLRAQFFESVSESGLAKVAWGSWALVSLNNSTKYAEFYHCMISDLREFIKSNKYAKTLPNSLIFRIAFYIFFPRTYVSLLEKRLRGKATLD